MRIGILTLPLHSNYGGILQAYALQTVLNRMGHETEVLQKAHEFYRYHWSIMPLVYSKRILKKLFRTGDIPIFIEHKLHNDHQTIHRNTNKFIDSHIKVRNIRTLDKVHSKDYDAIVVGSDQVWRKKYFNISWGTSITNAFLEFARNWDIIRIAYAASFGLDNIYEYTSNEVKDCAALSKIFDDISVREESAINICHEYFGSEVSLLLDPTMLLHKDDYVTLLSPALCKPSDGNLLCYILDPNEDKARIINKIASQQSLTPFSVGAPVENYSLPAAERVQPPLEQWLKGFCDADFVITDSFHACAFAIIFNKPFIAIGNPSRGMTRFTSLLSQFNLSDRLINDHSAIPQLTDIDWSSINTIRQQKIAESLNYLHNNLNGKN